MSFRVIDLFCGCGGLSCGFVQEDFEIIAAVDINSQSLFTYQQNFPNTKVLKIDLSDYSPQKLRLQLNLGQGELDCLVGGPPCQGFSKNVPLVNRTLKDPRNLLIYSFLSFVKEFQPKNVLIENVSEIVNAFDGLFTNEIIKELTKLGYYSKVRILNVADYGVPQLRRRAFFLATRNGSVEFPVPTHSKNVPTYSQSNLFVTNNTFSPYVSVWSAISDLPSIEAGGGANPIEYAKPIQSEYQQLLRTNESKVYDHVARFLSTIQLERVKVLNQGQGIKDLPLSLRPHQGYSGAYGRLSAHEPARTITRWVFHPGSGRFYHPYDSRVITIREAARLQSFPDWFVFSGTYIQKSHQVGEAVPPRMARKFAQLIRHNLLLN